MISSTAGWHGSWTSPDEPASTPVILMERAATLSLLLFALGLLLMGCKADNYFCDSSGCYVCDGLGCRSASPEENPDSCADTSACVEGSLCTAGICRPDDSVCQFNYECGSGRVCADGRCTESCSVDGDCAGEQLCADGYCAAPLVITGVCEIDDDCLGGEVCRASACVQGCGADADCDDGDFCDAGACRLDDRPLPPVCAEDTDCREGRACREGVCRTPCADDLDCQLVDVHFRYCIADLCVTENEVTTDCQTTSDCVGAELCVDGVCG